MSLVINGIYNIDEICEYKVIESIDIFRTVNVYDDSNVSNNVNVKEINFIYDNENIFNKNIEILSVDVDLKNNKTKKISNESVCIYIVNFIYIINIKVYIDSKIKDIKIKDIYSKSIIYKNINDLDLDVYAINFDLKNIDDKIAFSLNCLIIDKSKSLDIENILEENYKRSENIIKQNYSYIDTNLEFI
ncbi:MAG: hypothetical protein RSD22_09320 [Romboutsia sp.]